MRFVRTPSLTNVVITFSRDVSFELTFTVVPEKTSSNSLYVTYAQASHPYFGATGGVTTRDEPSYHSSMVVSEKGGGVSISFPNGTRLWFSLYPALGHTFTPQAISASSKYELWEVSYFSGSHVTWEKFVVPEWAGDLYPSSTSVNLTKIK